jgi:DNA-binding response OmpR family regulator
MNKIKILLAEDDNNLGNLLKEYLNAKDFDVTLASNGKEAFDFFKKGKYDICLLDVMMPVKDGYTLAKEIRGSNAEIPIIFLTAKSMKEDAIEGFNAGADDYITKPFSMEELILRIKAILRRIKNQELASSAQNEFKIADYIFNHTNQTLTRKNKTHKLTTKESDLLKLLCININDVLDRNFALNSIWQNDSYFNSRSMDVYIAKLRRYFDKDSKVEILNVHSKGFKLLVQQ